MKQKEDEEIKLWLVEVDWDPEPWEDYSMPYSVVRGTKKQAQKYVDDLYENAKQELYSGPIPFIEEEIVELGGKKC